MARVKVSITQVEGQSDHASGFEAKSLQEAGEKAIAYIVQQTGAADIERLAQAEEARAFEAATYTPKTLVGDFRGPPIVQAPAVTVKGGDETYEATFTPDPPKPTEPPPDPDAEKAKVVERMAKARAARAAKRQMKNKLDDTREKVVTLPPAETVDAALDQLREAE